MISFRNTSALALTVLLSFAPAAKADLTKDAALVAVAAVAGHVALNNPATTQNVLAKKVLEVQNKVPYAVAAHQKAHDAVQWLKANAFEVGAAATFVALVNHKLEGKPFAKINDLGQAARLLAEKLSAYSGFAGHFTK